jgi:hypothetical protein
MCSRSFAARLSRRPAWLVLILFPLQIGPGADAAERLYLTCRGQPQCTIIRGRDDDFAAERLARHLAEKTGAKVKVIASDQWQWQPSDKGGLILIGSTASNGCIATLASEKGIDLSPARLTDQGYVAKRLSHKGHDCLLMAGGGRDGAQYAVMDLIHWNLESDGKSAWVESLDVCEVPRLRYRWFWDWDSRMDWGAPGKASTVCGGPYPKPAGSFLIDAERCVDFMADHKFNGLILWGFLRDSHGGVAASQELCHYARRRGVRILPGVGTNDSYGGYYY